MKKDLCSLFDDVLFSRADLILRDDVAAFEKNFSAFIGTKFGVGLNSCTDALHLALYAADIGPGDEVITVAHTFVATIAAIIHCGATPVLVDIGEDHNMAVDQLEKAITRKTKAIMPVHLNGRVCNMEKVLAVAQQHHLVVIEDAAQAVGGTFDGRKAGSFGLASCFSFFPAKILGAAGDGGMLCTNDKNLADKVRLLRDHGRQTKETLAFYGFNSRLDNLQAAILNFKLRYLPGWIARRREIAETYRRGLSGLEGLKLPHYDDPRYFDVYQNYVVRSARRDALVAHLDKRGVGTLVSWPKPNHRQTPLKLDHFNLPMTERISREVVSLPMNTELTDDEVSYVVKSVCEFFNGGAR